MRSAPGRLGRPSPDGGTEITHTYDWSGVKDKRALPFFPRVTSEQMMETINRLGQAAGAA